jgi:hypothetical protein
MGLCFSMTRGKGVDVERPSRVRSIFFGPSRVRSIFFACLFPAGRGQVREYAIEEKYRAPSRMGIENSGEA